METLPESPWEPRRCERPGTGGEVGVESETRTHRVERHGWRENGKKAEGEQRQTERFDTSGALR